jgi:hypothetical protein
VGQRDHGAIGDGERRKLPHRGQCNDLLGLEVTALQGDAYVVRGTFGDLGSITPVRGAATGTVTAANSLTGSNVGDAIGEAVTPLPNGDFVVSSPSWAGNTGAVTHIRRGTDVGGMKVSAANSLVGAGSGSRLGSGKNADSAAPVTVLGNGNYVVCSPALGTVSQLKVGAATWVNASAPVVGTANASNSLIGAAANDRVCSDGVVALDGNDNYVVASPGFQAGSKRVGAASWGSGSAGIHGNVSTANSLVGYGKLFNLP